MRDAPLVGLTGFNIKEDRLHDRRTISVQELARLIGVAHRGTDFQAMTGPARALCYRLAASTGLRYSEIASIGPASFDWSGPSVRVGACYTKNRQEAELPLPGDLVDDLRAYVAALDADSPVFPLPAKGAAMLRADLEAAGIPYRDGAGMVFDFHSLRCQMATNADAAGISPRVVQRLMRHSSLELTGRYTRPRPVDIEAAASRLPSLRPAGDRTEAMAMTGTDGPSAHRQPSDGTWGAAPSTEDSSPEGRSHKQTLAHHLPTEAVGDVSHTVAMNSPGDLASANKKPLEIQGLDASSRPESLAVESTPDWTRTNNLRFRRPMLYPIELRVRETCHLSSQVLYPTACRFGRQGTA